MNTIIASDFQFLADFVGNLPRDFQSQGEVLYKVRNEVRKIEIEGVTVVVKKFKVPHFINRIAYTYFRKSKARRSYEYSETLLNNGFGAAQPIAYTEYFRNGLLTDSYYVSLFCDYGRDFNEFRWSETDGREAVLRSFAQFTARMHDAGIRHLDYGGGNILFRETAIGAEFCLIDVNRLEKGKVDIRKGCENFKLLYMKEGAFRFLMSEYALARGFETEQCFEIIRPYVSK